MWLERENSCPVCRKEVQSTHKVFTDHQTAPTILEKEPSDREVVSGKLSLENMVIILTSQQSANLLSELRHIYRELLQDGVLQDMSEEGVVRVMVGKWQQNHKGALHRRRKKIGLLFGEVTHIGDIPASLQDLYREIPKMRQGSSGHTFVKKVHFQRNCKEVGIETNSYG
jgi:hypothetical protein